MYIIRLYDKNGLSNIKYESDEIDAIDTATSEIKNERHIKARITFADVSDDGIKETKFLTMLREE